MSAAMQALVFQEMADSLPDSTASQMRAAMQALRVEQHHPTDSIDAVVIRFMKRAKEYAGDWSLEAALPDTVLAGATAAVRAGKLDSAKTLVRSALSRSKCPEAPEIDKNLDDIFTLIALTPDTLRVAVFPGESGFGFWVRKSNKP
jgi:hypothetical protein